MKRQRRIPFLTLLALTIALSGCVPSTSPEPAPSPTPTAAATAPPTPTLSPIPPTPSEPPTSTPQFATGFIVNGDFETGDLAGWLTDRAGGGNWFVYQDGSAPPDPRVVDPRVAPFQMPDPPEGNFSAVTDTQAPGRNVLYQDVMLDASYVLRLVLFYQNDAGEFNSPNHFRFEGGDNNQFRIDLMNASSPLLSLSDDAVLANIFRTREGDPLSLTPTQISFDLSPWVGQVVRVRFVEVDNNGPVRVGLDGIWLDPSGP